MNQLANNGTTLNKPNPTPHIHISHTHPYWLNKISTRAHNIETHNLHAYIKSHKEIELTLAF